MLSHFLPYVNLDFSAGSNYMTWQTFGLGKLGSVPHGAPIVRRRKHALGNQWWNPTKFLQQMDGWTADDDKMVWSIKLVATWNLWGVVHDSRITGRQWPRLERLRNALITEVTDTYTERRELLARLYNEAPANKDELAFLLLRLEELTALLNNYSENKQFHTISLSGSKEVVYAP